MHPSILQNHLLQKQFLPATRVKISQTPCPPCDPCGQNEKKGNENKGQNETQLLEEDAPRKETYALSEMQDGAANRGSDGNGKLR